MLTTDELFRMYINNHISEEKLHKIIYNKFLNKDLSNDYYFLENIVEVLNTMEIEYEYSLKYTMAFGSSADSFYYMMLDSEMFENSRKIHANYTHNPEFEDYKKFTFSYIQTVPYLQVTLHFPKFTIKNQMNKSKIIKDFFVRFYINKNGKIFNSNFEGTRTTYNNYEIKAGYRHSHLPKTFGDKNNPVWLNFSSMCLGHNNQIHVSMALLEDAIKKKENVSDFFELFVRNIISVIEYESIEGTPYIRMSKIDEAMAEVKAQETPFEVKKSASKYIRYYINNAAHLSLYDYLDAYHSDNGNAVYSLPTNDEIDYLLFDKVLDNNLDTLESDVRQFVKIEVDGRILNVDEIEIKSDIEKSSNYLKFNGKKYFLTIDDTIKLEKDNYKYVLSKTFKNYVRQQIKTNHIQRIVKLQEDATISRSESNSDYYPF
jgi:hypothetical protein